MKDKLFSLKKNNYKLFFFITYQQKVTILYILIPNKTCYSRIHISCCNKRILPKILLFSVNLLPLSILNKSFKYIFKLCSFNSLNLNY